MIILFGVLFNSVGISLLCYVVFCFWEGLLCRFHIVAVFGVDFWVFVLLLLFGCVVGIL